MIALAEDRQLWPVLFVLLRASMITATQDHDERSARRAAFAAGKELLMTWTSQGLGHLAEHAEVPIGAWSVIAHCSAFVGILG